MTRSRARRRGPPQRPAICEGTVSTAYVRLRLASWPMGGAASSTSPEKLSSLFAEGLHFRSPRALPRPLGVKQSATPPPRWSSSSRCGTAAAPAAALRGRAASGGGGLAGGSLCQRVDLVVHSRLARCSAPQRPRAEPPRPASSAGSLASRARGVAPVPAQRHLGCSRQRRKAGAAGGCAGRGAAHRCAAARAHRCTRLGRCTCFAATASHALTPSLAPTGRQGGDPSYRQVRR